MPQRPYNDIDFLAIINSAATDIEDELHIRVSENARLALLARVNAHRDTVEDEINSGRASKKSIKLAAMDQLRAASEMREPPHAETIWRRSDSNDIDAQAVVLSMRRACQWIPWC